VGSEGEKVDTSLECPSEEMFTILGMIGGVEDGEDVSRMMGRRSRVRRWWER
jgi:hypothetical protein